MKSYYKERFKRNKKVKSYQTDSDKFEKAIDEGVRDLMIAEYLKNVCQRYMILKYTIFQEASWITKAQIAAMGKESDYEDEEEEEVKNQIGSINLTHKTSIKVYLEQ